MRPTMNRLLVHIPIFYVLSCANAASSTLKVAGCNPGLIPFIDMNNGTLRGYDVDIWNAVYAAMLTRFNALKKTQNVSEELATMIGTSPPGIVPMPLVDIENGLENGTIDVGMCGLFVTEGRLLRYDFTNPFYFATGLQAVIKLRALQPSAQFIVMQLVQCIDGKTLLILILLLISVIVFGHLMSITDCWLHNKPIFRKSYFETVQDGIWLSFIMLSTVGFGDIVPRSLGARVLAIIWMFISIGLMAIIYAIMTSNFGNMNPQMLGDLEQINGIKDLAAFSVGSTLSPTAPEFRSRFISDRFTTYPSHQALFEALQKDEIQVLVERPEIVTYYNTMVDDFKSKMLTVGAVFNSDGVGFGVRRASEAEPHPLLNRLSLAVADATRTNWQSEDATRKLWFGEAERVTVDADTLEEMRTGGYSSVLLVLEYALAGAFGFWFLVSFLEFCWRYPKYKARNDTCAVVRDCLGLAPHGSLKDKMITASMRRDQVRLGLTKLIRVMRSKTELQGKFDSALATPRAPGAEPDAEKTPGPAVRRMSREGSVLIGEEELPFDLDRFASYVGEAMAREQHAGSASVLRSTGRMFLGRCWEWVSAQNYSKKGVAIVRELFLASYSTVIDDSDQFGTADKTECELQAAEDTVLHLLAQEERHWFREGSLMFAFRSNSSDDGGSEREQHQLLRVVNNVLEKQAAVLELLNIPPVSDLPGPPVPKEITTHNDRQLLNGMSTNENGGRPAAAPTLPSKDQASKGTQTDFEPEPEPPVLPPSDRGSNLAALKPLEASSLESPRLNAKIEAAPKAVPSLHAALNGSALDRTDKNENGHSVAAERRSSRTEDVIRSTYPAAFPTVIPPGSTAGYNYSMKAPINYSSQSAMELLGDNTDSTVQTASTSARSVRSPAQHGETLKEF